MEARVSRLARPLPVLAQSIFRVPEGVDEKQSSETRERDSKKIKRKTYIVATFVAAYVSPYDPQKVSVFFFYFYFSLNFIII